MLVEEVMGVCAGHYLHVPQWLNGSRSTQTEAEKRLAYLAPEVVAADDVPHSNWPSQF